MVLQSLSQNKDESDTYSKNKSNKDRIDEA